MLIKDHAQRGFHGVDLAARLRRAEGLGHGMRETLAFSFDNHFHPFVDELLAQLNKKSIDGLLDADFHATLKRSFFKQQYQPPQGLQDQKMIAIHHEPKEIDVSERGGYSIYNWELLFHAPLTIAVHLSKNQRFAESQRWFHYIFDPTANDGRFWRFLAFRGRGAIQPVDALLEIVSKPEDEASDEELDLKELVLSGYESLRRNPFQPHAVARTRFLAYQYHVVMKYLDNLIDWGDSLFRQDSMETLNEATQLYVLAANLLGPKPQRVPPRGRTRPRTFAQLRTSLDPLSNALVELEGQFPFNLYTPGGESAETEKANPIFGIGRSLYFCLPRNEKLFGYWDRVADRLFKLRNCMNIEGVVRQLPLFQPPIDPGMLVKAAAAGIDIAGLVSGLNQPLSPVRAPLLIQKAKEICNEVRGLGAALLSALEKRDGEELALLRQRQEITLQRMVREVRFHQWKEAEAATESLLKSRGNALERHGFYRRLLGLKEPESIDRKAMRPERKPLTEENFPEIYDELVGRFAQDVTRETYQGPGIVEGSQLLLNASEDAELNDHLPSVKDYQAVALGLREVAPALSLIPDFPIDLHFWGMGGTIILGGSGLTSNAKTAADILDLLASRENINAARAGKKAAYQRRSEEWWLQANLAAQELAHIGRQIIAGLIREQVARHEYENVKNQIDQANELHRAMRDKFTNHELYGWMQGELSKLHHQYYKFAFDIARKAEQTLKHELMRPELDALDFIKFNYWDGGRKGLLAGEALSLDLKRLEMAYHDHHKREYELTKSISLRQLDPAALLALKATGVCEVRLPEWLFDMDGPGHYMRRIKSVSLSIPAVTGPYQSLPCTLSLLKSTLRLSPQLRDDAYARAENEEDGRFRDAYGTIQSVVTSGGQQDSGLFETRLQGERFLPFEGAGVESAWKLRLPGEFRQFDYNAIADVVLHMRFTAREGGGLLAQKANEYLRERLAEAGGSGLVRLFSLNHDFPGEWQRFLTGEGAFRAAIQKEDFPYFTQSGTIEVTNIELRAIQHKELLFSTPDGIDLPDLNNALAEEAAFEIVLARDDEVLAAVLDQNPKPPAFVLIHYSFSA